MGTALPLGVGKLVSELSIIHAGTESRLDGLEVAADIGAQAFGDLGSVEGNLALSLGGIMAEGGSRLLQRNRVYDGSYLLYWVVRLNRFWKVWESIRASSVAQSGWCELDERDKWNFGPWKSETGKGGWESLCGCTKITIGHGCGEDVQLGAVGSTNAVRIVPSRSLAATVRRFV
ncbi:hypothetical protein HJFPF1_07035 [Paramyrothecium foliicola]|nr:hypothetical protein HJFPF1_07035 [Paramyrothecium foliicola]